MDNEAVIIIYGDIHLSDKPYGAHSDYSKESLQYFSEITRVAEEIHATHIIGTGDLTYSRFHTLEYRRKVEAELQKQYEITGGHRYEIKGNHDSATNGMTEYEFYEAKGLLKHVESIDVGNVHFTLSDYGKVRQITPNIVASPNDVNILVAHDYLKFKDTRLPNFGTAIELDEMKQFYDIDYIICGHIHKTMAFDGRIVRDGMAKEVSVFYPGCMSRPAYGDNLDEFGSIVVITVKDGMVHFDRKKINLWPIEQSFILEEIDERQEKKEQKENRIDISDVVKQLDSRESTFGNPEDRIMSMQGIDEKYKLKAIQLLQEA